MNLTDQILTANDADVLPVHVPQWDTTVYVRKFSAADRLKMSQCKDAMQATKMLLMQSLCDESGTLLFNAKNIDALLNKSNDALEVVAQAALEHNGISKGSAEAAGNG